MTPLQPRLKLEMDLPPELAPHGDDAIAYATLKTTLAVDLSANLTRGQRLHVSVRDEDAVEVGTATVRIVGIEETDVTAEGRVIASERIHKAKVVGR